MLCAYSIGAPIGAGQISRENHYCSYNVFHKNYKVPNKMLVGTETISRLSDAMYPSPAVNNDSSVMTGEAI